MTEENSGPPPFIAQLFRAGPSQEQIDQAHASMTDRYHRVMDFLNGLNEEQLFAVRQITIDCTGESSQLGPYYTGLITGLLNTKFGICPGCLKNHENELNEMKGDMKMPDKQETSVEVPDDISGVHGDQADVISEVLEDPPGVKRLSPRYLDLLDEYNLDWDEDGSIRVMCKGCENWYVSLEDRMRRRPDVCHFCIEKAKFG